MCVCVCVRARARVNTFAHSAARAYVTRPQIALEKKCRDKAASREKDEGKVGICTNGGAGRDGGDGAGCNYHLVLFDHSTVK
jgi:hypothetical protein